MENIDQIFIAALKHFVAKEKTQTIFAEKAGISISYLNDMIKERKSGGDKTKRKIADMLGYRGANFELFLDVGRAILAGKDPEGVDEPIDEVAGEELRNRGFITIPFSVNMKLAAGSGGTIPITENDTETTIIVHGPSIGRRNSHNLQAFKVGGDSMEPVIAEGGIVLADTSENDPMKLKEGHIYVICWDISEGECAVKYLRWAEKGRSVMISSPDNILHPPLFRDLKEIQLIGRVIWSCRTHN
jgi:hypothetical protein